MLRVRIGLLAAVLGVVLYFTPLRTFFFEQDSLPIAALAALVVVAFALLVVDRLLLERYDARHRALVRERLEHSDLAVRFVNQDPGLQDRSGPLARALNAWPPLPHALWGTTAAHIWQLARTVDWQLSPYQPRLRIAYLFLGLSLLAIVAGLLVLNNTAETANMIAGGTLCAMVYVLQLMSALECRRVVVAFEELLAYLRRMLER